MRVMQLAGACRGGWRLREGKGGMIMRGVRNVERREKREQKRDNRVSREESRDYLFFFFFQVEDGIRDYKVTGVQTCALPIYNRGEN